jgi:hypothetical protein
MPGLVAQRLAVDEHAKAAKHKCLESVLSVFSS